MGKLRLVALRVAAWRAFALLFLGVAGVAHGQGIPAGLQSVWQATGLPLSALSLHVQELDGPELIAVNASQPRNPASVMKVVTTWAGLVALGPEYRWQTHLMAAAGSRVDEQGTLAGPLYVKASGDPLFAVADLWEMLRELRMRGVKNLSEVVVDRSVFGPVTIDPHAFDQSGDRPYNASPDAMMVGLGAVRLIFYPDPGGKKWVPVIDPPLPGVRVDGQVAWRDGTCPGSPAVGTRISPAEGGAVMHLAGEAVGSCGSFSLWRLALSQEDHFEKVFRMLWRELGGTLGRDVRSGSVPRNAQPMVTHVSDTVADLIRRINKQSNNVMARMLLLGVGAELNGSGATPASAARSMLDLLSGEGVDTRGWVVENGSGLSRVERLTAQGLSGMLTLAWRSPLMPEYLSSMAISGVDGTVRRRLRNGAAKGMAHLKTGTLRDARALAGYVLGASGKRYSLVSLVNHDNAIAARPFEDALVAWLAGL